MLIPHNGGGHPINVLEFTPPKKRKWVGESSLTIHKKFALIELHWQRISLKIESNHLDPETPKRMRPTIAGDGAQSIQMSGYASRWSIKIMQKKGMKEKRKKKEMYAEAW